MVMLRHGIPLVPAELIGYHLGLIVPCEDASLFWNVKTGEKPLAGYGTRIYMPEYSPNEMFKKLEIPLRIEYHLIDEFTSVGEVKNYLNQIEVRDGDVLMCYDWGTLFDSDEHYGHVCVFDRLEGNSARIIDPAYRSPRWRIITTEKLFDAMKAHGPEKSGGFWEIKKES